MHLREDRRYIQDHDVERFAASGQTRLNMEMATTEEMLTLALRIKPHTVCFVPENRQELDASGGLDVTKNRDKMTEFVNELQNAGIHTSIFINPDETQVEAAARTGAPSVVTTHLVSG